jgi:osmotically-inducible protein OsmY
MNKRLWSAMGICVLTGSLSFVPCVFAHADASLTSLGTAIPKAGTLQFARDVLAQADTTMPSPKDRTNDVAITAKTKAALSASKETAGAVDAIHVQTNDGVVTLTGDVASQATSEHAQTVAAGLLGVRDVVNDLKYPHPKGSNSVPIVAPPTSATP